MNLHPVKKPGLKEMPPCKGNGPLQYKYNHSSDGIDLNLLILLHGFGDTLDPFEKLGKSLKLPQTATLSIQGPKRLPMFIIEEGYQWHESIDMNTGEPFPKTRQYESLKESSALLLELTSLITSSGYMLGNIFILGFAQGGTMAIEWQTRLLELDLQSRLGGLILIDMPAVFGPRRFLTRTLILRHGSKNEIDKRILSFCSETSKDNLAEFVSLPSQDVSMPASPQEWKPVFAFLGKELARYIDMGEVYEVRESQT